MDKRFWGFLVVTAVVLGGIFFVVSDRQANAPSGNTGTVTNHVSGEGKSGVRLVEYGDFECPACFQYFEPLKAVKEKYNEEITFQFRHFPIFSSHPNAIAASRAAEAAGMQGKFWEMHDLLYQNQRSWSGVSGTQAQSQFTAYAKQIGLNVDKFKTDVKSDATNDSVQADMREGNRLGVDSTPTFFIDGKKISTPQPTLEAFSKVIDAAIEQKTGKKPATNTEAPSEPSNMTE